MAQSEINVEEQVIEEIHVEEPRKYKVILHNDDKTTFDFVIRILQTVFYKTFDEAVEITKQVHITGSAVVGIYTKEIAEEKVIESVTLARNNGFPLAVTYEEL